MAAAPLTLRFKEAGGRKTLTGLGKSLLLVTFAVLAALGLPGCAASRPRSPSARVVERLDLLLTPVALDLDGKPGADGFGARVYASSRKSAMGAVLSAGRLEFVMYDGVVRTEDLAAAMPLRVWTYEAKALGPFAQKTSIGTSYRFALAWGDQPPRRERITVLARYMTPDGVVVSSAPGSIPLTVK